MTRTPNFVHVRNLTLKKLLLPEETETIDEDYFMNGQLRVAHIPKSVRIIKKNAFNSCNQLRKIVFEEDSVLEEIQDDAFAGCTALKEITFSNQYQYQRF